jgi:hypothetical protein
MRPAAAFRQDHRALIDEGGYGMVFANRPDGPRIAHLPPVWTCNVALHVQITQLSQSKPVDACTRTAADLEVRGSGAIAQLRRKLAS